MQDERYAHVHYLLWAVMEGDRARRGGMYFMPRDRAIVLLLASYEFLDTSNIHEYLGTNDNLVALRARLRKLTDYGYLYRVRPPIVTGQPGSFSDDYVYRLGPNGVAFAKTQTDGDGTDCLSDACRAKEHWSSLNWLHEKELSAFQRRLGERCDGLYFFNRWSDDTHDAVGSGKERIDIRPDAFFGVRISATAAHDYFLEWQRSKPRADSEIRKARNYYRYIREGHYEGAYGKLTARTLFVKETAEKAANLRDRLRLEIPSDGHSIFYVTDAEAASSINSASHAILLPVANERPERCSLID